MSEPAALPLATVARETADRPGHGPAAASDGDALLRLALWLAEVAAEAALAARPGAGPTPGLAARRLPGDADSPAAESP